MEKAPVDTQELFGSDTSDSDEATVGDIIKRPAADAAKKAKLVDKDAANPSYCHEGSRPQFLVRTGVRGMGQSTSLPYSNDKEKKTQEIQAKAMCRKLCRDRGLPIPARFQRMP